MTLKLLLDENVDLVYQTQFMQRNPELVMSLVISRETLEKIEMSEEQLRIEIAVMLFQQERFTLAQAARFAQINQLAFQRLLASRRIPLHYGMEELMEDFYSLKDSVRAGLEAI